RTQVIPFSHHWVPLFSMPFSRENADKESRRIERNSDKLTVMDGGDPRILQVPGKAPCALQ
ncbi:MAG TPA: hypothetical protein VMH30_00890, partial [Verrucomicrobiae bacterium]|nr:hypothetical protein [Verrucomicrobiae bacterium]